MYAKRAQSRPQQSNYTGNMLQYAKSVQLDTTLWNKRTITTVAYIHVTINREGESYREEAHLPNIIACRTVVLPSERGING